MQKLGRIVIIPTLLVGFLVPFDALSAAPPTKLSKQSVTAAQLTYDMDHDTARLTVTSLEMPQGVSIPLAQPAIGNR